MIPAISETTQGPRTLNSYFANLAIDNNEESFFHTLASTEDLHWWKAKFKTTVHITKFTVVARIGYENRMVNIKVFTVLYNTRVGQGAQTEEKHLVDLNDITTTGRKTFELTNAVMADEILLKLFHPSGTGSIVMNFAEIYIWGY